MAFRRRPAGPSDDEKFLANIYEQLLGRAPDAVGYPEYLRQLHAGRARVEIAHEMARSDECFARIAVDESPRRSFPDRFRLALDNDALGACWVFDADTAADFDWMEARILADGYYETPGVWALDIDDDKRVMAELVAQFQPRRALEVGCSSGAVLRVLLDHGIVAEGIEISRMAHEHAHPEVQANIHLGDVLDLTLAPDYDFVFGLDIFEHLNPNRLARYLDAMRAAIVDGGWLFTVVPAFGKDPVFGEVFPSYLAEWDADIAADRPFRALHTDDAGYPMHGHLIWAHTNWWVAQFERAGFVRQPAVEAALQDRYRAHFRVEHARQSCYVFSAGPAAPHASEVIERMQPRGA